jgi:hypothetical protein
MNFVSALNFRNRSLDRVHDLNIFGFYSGQRNRWRIMSDRIWLVTDGTAETALLGVFSSKFGAERYRTLLVEQYALGRNLSVRGKQLAQDAGAWTLGMGPAVVAQEVDLSSEALPGAWVVRVDETCRMVSCEFTTKVLASKQFERYRVGIHHVTQAYGSTPQAALDGARRAMVSYLTKGSRRY